MSTFRNTATFAFKLGAGILLVSSCENLGSDCDYLKSCPSGGAGGSAGNTASSGGAGSSSLGGSGATGGRAEAGNPAGGAEAGAGAGAEAGGAGGAAGASGEAGNGGVGGAPPCNGACGGATPNCEPVSNQCVECLTKSDCPSAKPACDALTNTCVECVAKTDCKDATPACDSATNTCVECIEQADCPDPSASQCDLADHTCKPCTLDADCSDIDGKGVCLAGNCVECTATKATACGSEKGTPLVCDSLEHTCTSEPARSAGLCQPCLSDAQCALGQLCVLDTLGSGNAQKSVGYFCHWKQGDTANGAPALCSGARPYFRTLNGVTSIDGDMANICALAVSSCPANNEFRDKNCAPTGTPDDTLCGVSPPDDAKCAQIDASTYRCTMTCLSQDDCPSPSTCNTSVIPRVCTL